MRTNIEFRSRAFPPYDTEESEINPGRWGKRLAEFLSEGLKKKNVPVEELRAEDWGWAIHLKHDKFPMWIGCGNYDEYEDGFLVFIEPSKPKVRKGIFKKVDTQEDLEALAVKIEETLKSNEEIRDIRWWSEDEK